MPRGTSNNASTIKSSFLKDESFDEIFRLHKNVEEEGWYRGSITGFDKKDRSLIASADIYSLEGDTFYGSVKGFLSTNYSEDDLTFAFMEAFDHPKKISDVIGKPVKVYVAFTEGRDGIEYPNIYGFEKL